MILTEEPLNQIDAESILATVAEPDVASAQVLFAAASNGNLLTQFVDAISQVTVPQALNETSDSSELDGEAKTGQEGLAVSIDALSNAGLKASGEVVTGHPVASLVAEVKQRNATSVVVVTTPHALEDTFGQDWASKAQRKLDVPVLHLYAGSGFIGNA